MFKNKEIKQKLLWKKYKSEKNIEKKHKLENQLIEQYYPLVKKIAYKLAERISWKRSPEELTSFGVDGLYVSIKRFDLRRKVRFSSYASIRINGSMLDGIRKEDQIPRSVRINNNRFKYIKSKLEVEKNRYVTEHEVIEEMGLKQEEYFRNMKKYNPAIFTSLENSGINQNNQDNFKQDSNINLIDNNSRSPDFFLRRKEFFSKLLGKNFSYLERKIIYYYYYEKLTMEEISRFFDISESRVSQIHAQIIPRLKNKIKRNPRYFAEDIYKYTEKNIEKDIQKI